jgi:hypothetical protein
MPPAFLAYLPITKLSPPVPKKVSDDVILIPLLFFIVMELINFSESFLKTV